MEVPSLSDDEGNDITVCSSLDVAPGAVLRDIEVKFELVEDTAGLLLNMIDRREM